ncbi:MAG TPA: M55 family metallopeptidase [Candidatus Krumholzibacteriaceae bacterium]|jgi:D-amino peptidase|nr:M55 family metallopeptidase [Candidatus Krumholzibacteriaceae bacterium]
MKALISVDLEGMPYIVIPGQLGLKGTLYTEARRIATKVTLTVAEELNKNGFDQVVIADSHGPMVNLLIDDLPEYIEIIRGYPRPLSMMAGIEGCDTTLLLGYHAKFGTAKSTFDHTISGGIIHRIEVNGIPCSEFLLNAYLAGEFKVPVIMVAGEAQLLKDDVKKYAPWVETVALKQSLSRLSARSPAMKTIEKDLQKAVRKAVQKYQKHEAELLVAKNPIKMGVTFQRTQFADAAELLPLVKRVEGLKVEFTAKNMTAASGTLDLLILAAWGVEWLLQSLG